MGDAWNKGGRDEGRSGWSGEDRQRPQRDYSEHWLEREVHDLYQNVVDEPVPKNLIDIVRRIPNLDE